MSNRNRLLLSVLAVLTVAQVSLGQALTAKNEAAPPPVAATAENDRSRDGLVGPVRRVRTEITRLSTQAGRLVEGKRALLEMAAYDLKGNKTENQYFPVEGATLTGKEVYKYDDKGNISEMTLVNEDGSLLSKETYKYEFDFAGNWNKMTTYVAVVDTGKVTFEPTEITYRQIMYYLDEKMFKMTQTAAAPPASQPVSQPASQPASQPVSQPTSNEVKPQPSPAQNTPKNSPALPSSLEKVSVMNPAEVRTVSGSADAKPQVELNAEPPPPVTPRMILKPVSGGVLNGAALNLPAPMYPEAAKRMSVSGTVTVEVLINEQGKVMSAKATSGPPALREAAAQAAMRAKFSPTKLSGQPVKVTGIINYKFTLAN